MSLRDVQHSPKVKYAPVARELNLSAHLGCWQSNAERCSEAFRLRRNVKFACVKLLARESGQGKATLCVARYVATQLDMSCGLDIFQASLEYDMRLWRVKMPSGIFRESILGGGTKMLSAAPKRLSIDFI